MYSCFKELLILNNGSLDELVFLRVFFEEEILKKFSEILDNTPKENIVDIMFPSHRIVSIRSLVFNANKPSTLVK